jgi:primosomal protein N' (replication factor Y)
MLPEINQVIRMEEECREYFGDEAVALHGNIPQRKKIKLWNDIRSGKYKLVIGTRISVFAPITNLGLIIVFDEHDGAYKQQELSPRYNARDVAIKRGDIDDSVVLMSSSTPDVRVYYAALENKVRFLSLPKKTKVQNNLFKLQQMNTEIVDMRDELRKGQSGLFSGKLISGLSDAINKKLKALLFLNRRGKATLIQCRKCDYVVSCKNCDLPMNLHTSSERFLCHQCGFNLKIFENCPTCQTVKLSYYGSGTELAVNEINRIFPKAKVVRWDSDSIDLKRKTINTYHQEILDGNYDVLVGTQAIPKDFDVSSVGFFGVIVSDVGFNLPSFYITERSFQLLSQVMTYIQSAKLISSRTIVQTFDPSNNAVVAAVKSDYDLFYKEEIQYRLLLSNPPFTRIIRLMYSHRDYDTCYQKTHKMAKILDDYIKNTKMEDVYIIAPSRGYPFRVRNKYRYQIFVKGTHPQRVIYSMNFSTGWLIDVDPIE